MNRIDRIISESIDRFILREISMSDFENPNWKGLGRKKKKQPQPQPQPNIPQQQPQQAPAPRGRKRIKPKTLADAITTNQVGMVIKNEWYSQALKAIASMSRNLERMFGVGNARILRNYFNAKTELKAEGQHDLFILFSTNYRKICELTKEVEQMAKQGNVNEKDVISRMADMPRPLNDLAIILDEMGIKAKSLKILAKQQRIKNNNIPNKFVVNGDIQLPDGNSIKSAVINGYATSAGLNNLIIFDQGLVETERQRLFKLANYIRDTWGDNLDHGLHSKRIR